MDIRTEKGKALAADLGEVPDADATLLARREQFWEDARRFLNKYLLKCAPTDLPVLLETRYDHPIWEHNSSLCYSCGSCNMVCPTCYCFDVQDSVDWTLDSGERVRKWDSCMLRDFAQVAGGTISAAAVKNATGIASTAKGNTCGSGCPRSPAWAVDAAPPPVLRKSPIPWNCITH